MQGIYKIVSPTGCVYVGQSTNLKKRFREYRRLLQSKDQVILHSSFITYGIDSHEFLIIEECEIIMLNDRERHWQDHYDVLGDKGMNCRLTTTLDKPGVLRDIVKQKMSISRFGKKHSEAQLQKAKERGCAHLHPGYGSDNHFYGKKHSVETVEKIRAVHTGNKYCVGRVLSEETRSKIGLLSRKKVINKETGEIFVSAKALSKHIGSCYSTVLNKLNGSSKNNTPYEYV